MILHPPTECRVCVIDICFWGKKNPPVSTTSYATKHILSILFLESQKFIHLSFKSTVLPLGSTDKKSSLSQWSNLWGEKENDNINKTNNNSYRFYHLSFGNCFISWPASSRSVIHLSFKHHLSKYNYHSFTIRKIKYIA